MAGISVGIDLGTTNSCVAVYQNEKIEIVRDSSDNYIVPSIVTFTEDGRLIGNEAKENAYLHVQNTIYEVKRLIGQNFLDDKVKSDVDKFPYKVINDNGIPKIQIQVLEEIQTYYPEEISAFLLEKLKSNVEEYVGEIVERVVVTTPAYFNVYQRDATKKAAKLAGFKEVHIINEPTAAAIGFNYQHSKSQIDRNVLVYDFGGGTFDVSIATINKNKCDVKATLGDLHLGGTDIDLNLINYIRDDFHKKFGVHIEMDATKMQRMKNICEKAKKSLSGKRNSTKIELSSLEKKYDYETQLSRLKFEQINKELFEKTIDVVKTCLTSANLKVNDIDEVLLVGGSTRIPKIQDMLRDLFGKEKINKTLNPDECVAYGAVIHCIGNKVEVQDITALDLGVAIWGKKEGYQNLEHSVIISRNTPIPVSKSQVYTTLVDNQTVARISIYQGDNELVKHNSKLGDFIISNLTEAPAGVTKINVYFSLNEEGILDVTASEIGKNNSKSTKIDIEQIGLTGKTFEKKLAQMEMEKQNRHEMERYLVAKHELESLCQKILSHPEEYNLLVCAKSKILLNWLETTSINDFLAIEEKKNNLISTINLIL